MENEQLKTAAEEFSETQYMEHSEYCIPFAVKFAQSLIDNGDLLTADDYKRFRDEIKGEADLNALSCAVADVEQEYDATIESLKKNISTLEKEVAAYVKLLDRFIDNDSPRLGLTVLPPLNFKTAEEVLTSFGWEWQNNKNSPLLKAMEVYADQKYASHASTVKVTDNEIFMQAVKLFPLAIGDGEDRETWIKGFKAYREQLTGNL